MTANGQHLSEEQLIEHYYGEDAATSQVGRHLKACAQCTAEYAALERDLSGVKPVVPPPRGAGYGDEVWRSIRGSLPVYEARRNWSGFGFRRPFALAAACVLLMVAAFVAGRTWQRKQAAVVANNPATGHGEARERVVVWVLGDHLDRSERLLVALNHARGRDAAEPLQSEARELLAANRLVRQSAKQSGDPTLDAALDRLERLLVEVANQPGGLTESDLNRIRQEMNTDGLLFDVRVLRSRVTEQRPIEANGLKGVSL